MKVYYSRCMQIYGTPQEERDFRTIRATFPGAEIIEFPPQQEINDWANDNPNGPVMSHFFLPLVEEADVLVFRALPGGDISAGVATEIEYAQQGLIPVLELLRWVGRNRLSVDETRGYLREVGER